MFFRFQRQVEELHISIPKLTFIYSFSLESSSLLTLQTEARRAAAADSPLDPNEPPPASIGLPVLPHLSCDGVHDFHIFLVLSIILQELSIGSHQVHDDGVVHLEVMGARVQDTALSPQQQQQQQDKSGEHSQCSRCLRPLAPDCSKLCRLWKLPPPGPLFPSGRSTWAKTLKKTEETSVRNNGRYKE